VIRASIYLVTDAGRPVTAFTTKADMKAHLKRMRGWFTRPLVHKFGGDGCAPVIMTCRGRWPIGESLRGS
jgi:hypothetical protein